MIQAVLEHDGQELRRMAGRFVVPEAAKLTLRIQGQACTLELDGRTVPWDPTVPGATVELPHAIGTLDLAVSRNEDSIVLPLDLVPSARKLGGALWSTLVAELSSWLPSLLGGVEGPRHEGLELNGLHLPAAVEACHPLLPDLYEALDAVARSPHLIETRHPEDIPIHQVRRAAPAVLAWMSRHPNVASHLRTLSTGRAPTVSMEPPRDTVDHPVNRHLVWLMGRVTRDLRQAAASLRRASASTLNATALWRDPRAMALERWGDLLQCRIRNSPFRHLRPEPASGTALLILNDHPTYARAHRLGRLILRLGLGQGAPSIATRPSFHLYEIWSFLATGRALTAHLGRGWASTWSGLNHLTRLNGTGEGACLTLTRADSTVRLEFNPSFKSRVNRPFDQAVSSRHSLTRTRRPDLVLSWSCQTQTGWAVLDAKYRAGREALADAFGSAHIYQDSLRWPAHGGRPQVAVLLVPAAEEELQLWFDVRFVRQYGIGAIALRPGTSARAALSPLFDLLPRNRDV